MGLFHKVLVLGNLAKKFLSKHYHNRLQEMLLTGLCLVHQVALRIYNRPLCIQNKFPMVSTRIL